MTRHHDDALVRSQESIFYYLDVAGLDDEKLHASPDYRTDLYPQMLIEDVAQGIMPIGGRAEKRPFRVILAPTSATTEKMVGFALTRDEWERDFASAVCEFFRDCAQIIMTFGECIYEIVYLSQRNGGRPVEFELSFIRPSTVTWRWGRLVQYVPADVAHQRGVSKYVKLTPERILRFKPPPSVRGKLLLILDSLTHLGNRVFPDFALPSPRDLGRTVPYDSLKHIRTQKQALAEVAGAIGWNGRGLFQEEMLEYYWLHRQLRFEQFKLELRDSILGTLNEGLARVGREIGFSARLLMEGLPTLADVETAQAKLSAGNSDFKAILDPFLI